MRNRTLSLKKETLAELSSAELDSVVGGNASGYSCLVINCGSDFQQCLTGLQCLPHTGATECYTGTPTGTLCGVG